MLASLLVLALASVGCASNDRRREAVREAFRHSMSGYARAAWGHDEVRPTTNRTNDSWGGFGVYLFDGLDTAVLMEETELVERAVALLAQRSFLRDWDAHVFEYSIRYLGGALAAYQLRGRRDASLLASAQVLGDCFARAFETSTGLPFGIVNLQSRVGKTASWLHGAAVLAEAGSVQLEFAVLSAEMGNPKYGAIARKAFDVLVSKQPEHGLFPLFIDIETGQWRDQAVSTGALGDSFYEMLIKLWIFEGAAPGSPLLGAWNASWAGMKQRLLRRSGKSSLLYLAEIGATGTVVHRMGHLSCHMPAVLALAFRHTRKAEYLATAEDLLNTCWRLYEDAATGLGPETVEFFERGERGYEVVDAKYILRPEVVESLFYLWRITNKEVYRERAWRVFEALSKHCRVPGGFSGLTDVNQPGSWNDSQQSFFFAETLKYLFLIFSDSSVLNLNEFVFSTEGHPFQMKH
jgi:mannosyl-oligosaccharide alpha-1,2-mannosidase